MERGRQPEDRQETLESREAGGICRVSEDNSQPEAYGESDVRTDGIRFQGRVRKLSIFCLLSWRKDNIQEDKNSI